MIVLPFFNRISSWFGPRKSPTAGASSNHKGIDIAADAGAPICAAMGGTIVKQEKQKGYGNVIYINHPDGTQTRYAHMQGFTGFKVGDAVNAGEQIGYVGSTGVSTGNHLHFEWRDQSGTPRDPWPLLSGNAGSGMSNYPIASNYRKDKENRNLAATQNAMNDVLFLEYAKQNEAMEKAAKKNKGTGINWRKGGWLFMLIGAAIDGISDEKKEKNATAQSVKSAQIKVSKSEMAKMGFTNHEIDTLSLLSSMQKGGQTNQTNATSGNTTLHQSGKIVTDEELAKMGFSAEKINIINNLYEQQSQKV